MPVTAFRLNNFMGFDDTGWIDLTHINLLFGSNSAGKSAIIRAMLLLQQSVATWRPTDVNGRQERRQDSLVFSEPNGHDLGSFLDLVRDHDTNRAMTFGFRHEFSFSDDWTMSGYFDGFIASLQQLGIVATDLDPDAYSLETIVLDTELSYHLRMVDGIKQVSLCAFGLYRASDNWDILEAQLDESSQIWRFDSSTFGLHDSSFTWPPLRFITKSSFFPLLDAPEGGLPQPRRTDYGMDANFSAYFGEEQTDKPSNTDTTLQLLKETSDTLTAFQTLLNFTLKDDIHKFVAFSYLGPIRPKPQRYIRAIQRPAIVNSASLEDILRLWLDAKADRELKARLDQFNNWLENALGVRFAFRPADIHDQVFEFIVMDGADFEANIADVGFGISQILPLLIHAACEGDTTMIIVEQPELHLHPSAQAELADLFVLLGRFGTRCLIETHSENLLLRLRRRIAETTFGVSGEFALTLNEFRAYFVNRSRGDDDSFCSTIEQMLFDVSGDYESRPSGFGDFFGQDYEELRKMKLARFEADTDDSRI